MSPQMYTYEVDVHFIAGDPGATEEVRIVMLRPNSARPVLSALVDMPASLPPDDAGPP